MALFLPCAYLWSASNTSYEFLGLLLFDLHFCHHRIAGNYTEGGPKPGGPRQAIFSDDICKGVIPIVGATLAPKLNLTAESWRFQLHNSSYVMGCSGVAKVQMNKTLKFRTGMTF